MIDQGFLKSHFLGRDGFIWWIGQIVDKTKWEGNIPGNRTANTGGHAGFDQRYKVRIMGYHTADPEKLSDDDLPWASVMLPVTAGGGTGGSSQTPNLRQGNFVYGFFLDGEDAQQPIIMGVIGYNDYTQVLNDVSPVGFKPFEGYDRENETVAIYSLKSEKEKPPATQVGGPELQETDALNTQATGNINNSKIQSTTGAHSIGDGASAEQKKEGEKERNLARPTTCKSAKTPISEISQEIQTVTKEIESIRRTLTEWDSKVSTKLDDAQRKIEERTKYLSDFTTQKVTTFVNEIENATIKAVNDAAKPLFDKLLPIERTELKAEMESANDLLACLFRTEVSNLFGIGSNLSQKLFDKNVSLPACVAQDFDALILGDMIPRITGILDQITSSLNALLGIPSGAIDVALDAASILDNVFSYLSCDTDPKCGEVDKISPWKGPGRLEAANLDELFEKAKAAAGINIDSIFPDIGGFDTIALESIYNDVWSGLKKCSGIGPQPCGSPTLDVFGGEGGGIIGNVITTRAGEILGIDLVSGGSGYSEEPFIKIDDNCGTGSGVVAKPILSFDISDFSDNSIGGDNAKGGCIPLSGINYSSRDKNNQKNATVIDIVIVEPGKNYLPAPDGSLGSAGRTFSKKNQTNVRRKEGCYDLPYNPGEQIPVTPGDYVKFPGKEPEEIVEEQIITAPELEELQATENTYRVAPLLENLVLIEPGFDYQVGDQILIDGCPSGTITKVSPTGTILDFDLPFNDCKRFFDDFPKIVIRSISGFNGKLAPSFNFLPVEPDGSILPSSFPDQESQLAAQISPDVKLISVIDCVGKIPPRRKFLTRPE